MVANKNMKLDSTITYRGQQYRLAFTLNVMQEIQEEYGTLEAWGNKAEGKGKGKEPDAKAVIFGFAAMINEGIDMANDENGTDIKPLTLKQVGRLITEVGLVEASKKMSGVVNASTEDGSKNE